MLRPYKLTDYIQAFKPQWTCEMPDGCPPEDVMVAEDHPFYRLSREADSYSDEDFKSYAELFPEREWGERLPLAVGLSVIDNGISASRLLKLPLFQQFKGVISLRLYQADGVVKHTGAKKYHYTWWRTTAFTTSNLNMLKI